ncbi:MAG: DinB family protein [Chloroflexota bacterium]
MLERSINRLVYLVETAPILLMEIPEQDFSFKADPAKWSKKEIIGHLIDSATNNHHRLVRGQFEQIPEIQYDQDKWRQFSYYQHIESSQIISFWTIYNKQLIEIIKRIPKASLSKQVKIGNDLYSLEQLIVDYVNHLEHHLRQVIKY